MIPERERLEQAIAHLEAQRAILGDAVVEAALSPLREKLAVLESSMATDQARKHITVLFADVSDFTAMSDGMDAEDISVIINALWGQLDKAIIDHGGTIDKHMGDAVMGLWGVEVAREDDPAQATRAALAMQAGLASFRAEQKLDLSMRIGINTGPVLLGKVGTMGEYTAIGDTVNIASRLEHAAPLNSILISHDTYRHIRGIFDVQPLAPIQVKGKAEPIQAHIVQRAKPRAFHRITRSVEGTETRMIGRDSELKCLQDIFSLVGENYERRVVTIVGEAGVGKSRLLYEFEDWLDLLPEEIHYFKGRASPAMQNVPQALIRDLFVFRFQIHDSDDVEMVRQKVEVGLGEALGMNAQGQMRAHFVGQLLGFDFSTDFHLQGLQDDAKQIRDRALIYLSEFFQVMAALAPTVIFLEDTHWADDSSLDILSHLAVTTPEQRLLIVCLARPTLFERRPHWGEGQTFHTRLELQPLSTQDSRRLVEEILQKVEKVPATLQELVVNGAEGNPFYVEELIKMFVEDGLIIKEQEHWRVEPTRLTSLRIPPTLTRILQARLDSLPAEERTILQQASVVGRIFWDSTVEQINESVSAKGGEWVQRGLLALREKEMVFRRETSAFAGTREYLFKHAVLREVTYEGVLKRVRRIYHALVAEWLIERSGQRLSEYVGLIADHLEQAGRTEQATTYLRQAGEQAAMQFANTEAVDYFSRALALMPETKQAERYALLLAREKVYDLQGVREAQGQDLAALRKLADTLNDDRRRAEVALRRANYAWLISDYTMAIAAALQAVTLARSANMVEGEASGYYQWGRALVEQMHYATARERFEQSLALARTNQLPNVEAESLRGLGNIAILNNDYDQCKVYQGRVLNLYRETANRRGESIALFNLGVTAFHQGDYDEANLYIEQALDIFREIGDRLSRSHALHILGDIARHRGDCPEAKAYYKQALGIYRETGDRTSESQTMFCLGMVTLAQGNYVESQAYCEQARHLGREIGQSRIERWALAGLGQVAHQLGDYDKAREYYEQTLRLLHEIGDRRNESSSLALHGLLLHHLGDNKGAQVHSQQALRIAQDIGVRLVQTFALTSLGHALAELGLEEEALDAYQQALDLQRELGQRHRAMESLAGLARISLARKDLIQAQNHIEEILNYLETNPLDGTDEPFRIYLTCYRILHASQDPRAQDILTTAHTLLQERAAKIEDEKLHRSFLENVAAHREIAAAFASRE